MVPHDAFKGMVRKILPQSFVVTRDTIELLGSMSKEHVCLSLLGILPNLWADEFIGGFRPATLIHIYRVQLREEPSECFTMPVVLWAITHWYPSRCLSGDRIGVRLGCFKAFWCCLTALQFVALVKHAITGHATG